MQSVMLIITLSIFLVTRVAPPHVQRTKSSQNYGPAFIARVNVWLAFESPTPPPLSTRYSAHRKRVNFKVRMRSLSVRNETCVTNSALRVVPVSKNQF